MNLHAGLELHGGLDLHGDNVYLGLMDKQFARVFEKRLPNDLPTILSTLEKFRDRIAGLVVESTYNWYWLVDGLLAAKYRVKLANPARMVENIGLKHADDRSDAFLSFRTLFDDISGMIVDGVRQNKCKLSDGRAC